MFNMKKIKLFVVYFTLCTLLAVTSCASLPRNEPIVIPFTIENDHIVIYARVNGVDGRYIWDTGSEDTHTFISLDNLTPLPRNLYPYHVNSYYIKDDIVIDGHIIRSKSIINYIPSNTHPQWEWLTPYLIEKNFDGIIGLSLFSGWWLEVSFSTNTLILHRSKPSGFDDFTYAWVTFRVPSFFPTTFYAVGSIDDVFIGFLIDTGANLAFNFPRSIREQLSTDYQKMITIDDIYYEIPTSSISVMGDVFNNMTIIADGDGDIALLGLEFLQRYDFLFDMRALFNIRTLTSKRNRFYFKQHFIKSDEELPLGGIFPSANPNPFGLRIRRVEKGFFVAEVRTPGFTHDELNLRPGMTLTIFNGRNLAGLETAELSIILAHLFDGGTGELVILDADGTERVIIYPLKK